MGAVEPGKCAGSGTGWGMTQLVIGLAGPRGCGKSTAAHYLAEEFQCLPMAFADPIREAALRLFPDWDPAVHFEAPFKDRRCPYYQVSPREVLRALGEHAREVGGSLVYVRELERRLGAMEWFSVGGCPRVVVQDVRFPLEAEWIRQQPGGVVVHVQRSGVVWSGEHVSEQGPGEDPADLRLQNPADLAVLRVQVRALWAVVRGRVGCA